MAVPDDCKAPDDWDTVAKPAPNNGDVPVEAEPNNEPDEEPKREPPVMAVPDDCKAPDDWDAVAKPEPNNGDVPVETAPNNELVPKAEPADGVPAKEEPKREPLLMAVPDECKAPDEEDELMRKAPALAPPSEGCVIPFDGCVAPAEPEVPAGAEVELNGELVPKTNPAEDPPADVPPLDRNGDAPPPPKGEEEHEEPPPKGEAPELKNGFEDIVVLGEVVAGAMADPLDCRLKGDVPVAAALAELLD
jgi:hypothetical protein